MHRVGNYNFVFQCRPSSGHILEALHVDPASGVSLEKDKIVKLPKPSVRYGHDCIYQVYFGGNCLILYLLYLQYFLGTSEAFKSRYLFGRIFEAEASGEERNSARTTEENHEQAANATE